MDVATILVSLAAGAVGSTLISWLVLRSIKKIFTHVPEIIGTAVEHSMTSVRNDIDSLKTHLAFPTFTTAAVATPQEVGKVDEDFDKEKQRLLNRVVEERDKNYELQMQIEVLNRDLMDIRIAQHREREINSTNKANADNRLKEVIKSYQLQLKELRDQINDGEHR